jgi:hypothetical protein
LLGCMEHSENRYGVGVLGVDHEEVRPHEHFPRARHAPHTEALRMLGQLRSADFAAKRR